MQITPGQLFAEAGAMALEIRLKDAALTSLQEENRDLRARLEPGLAPAVPGNGPETGHSHGPQPPAAAVPGHGDSESSDAASP